MDRQTLFTTLVRRFAAGRVEVLATAGLGYILEQSAECRQSLQALVDACGASVSADLDYRTQATGDDAAIPDLVGAPPGAGPELIIEGKFWAGLTANGALHVPQAPAGGSARLPPLRGPIRPHGDAVAEAEGARARRALRHSFRRRRGGSSPSCGRSLWSPVTCWRSPPGGACWAGSKQ